MSKLLDQFPVLPGASEESKKVCRALSAGRIPCDPDHLVALLYVTIDGLLSTGGDPNGIVEAVEEYITGWIQRQPVAGSA